MIYKGDIGAKIIVTVTENISLATVKTIKYKKPDGTVGSWTAVAESGNLAISYTTTAITDLDQAGTWILQAYIEMPGWSGHGDVSVELEIGDNQSVETGAITVGTNSWVTLAEAEAYFRTRLGSSGYWNGTANKVAALVTAFKQLLRCGMFNIAATDTAQAIKDAQCEMALFLLIHQEDMDSRAGLQAQGVTKAGIVQEEYSGNALMVPANVLGLLQDLNVSGAPLYATDLTRDDAEDV